MTGAEVRDALRARTEIALLDVRDEAVFAEGHPLFAASLPLGHLELDVLDRVPRLTTPLVVCDDDGGELAHHAIERLGRLGYSRVSVLRGGLQAWRDEGGEVFRDVNSPSKAFGELVEARRHTPFLDPHELRALLDRSADVVVLDARRHEEYQTMSIPAGVSVPGAELVYRVGTVAPRPDTFVVVNCAGRTRSIIGAQSLVNAGIPNRVAALCNGTIGWTLAGLGLERGQRRVAEAPSADDAVRARAAARNVADCTGVGRVDKGQLDVWAGDIQRTLYRFDVRTPDEYAAGHPAGFRSAPGGQLVQETDVFAPVRGARIVLWDDQGARADMTASWLAQMWWDVHVLDAMPEILSLATGPWRPTRPPGLDGATGPIVKAYKRPYEGTDNAAEAMQAYLDWELGLVAQLDRDLTHGFWVL